MTTTETVSRDSDLSSPLDKGSSGKTGETVSRDSDLSSPLDKQSSGQHDYTYVPAEETVSSSITSYV